MVFANRPDPNTPMEGRSTSYPPSQFMQGRASCSEVLVTVKPTHTGHSGQRWPGPWVGEGWPQALISLFKLAVFRTSLSPGLVLDFAQQCLSGTTVLFDSGLVPLGGLRGLLL